MSEKTEKEKMRNGSAKETQGMRRRQGFWGILMLLSLVVMLVAGIFAVKAAKERQGGMTPSYAASDAGDATKDGENGQSAGAGRHSGQLAAVLKQEMGIWAVGKKETENGAQEGTAFREGKPIGGILDGGRPDENAVDVGGSNISTSETGKPIGNAMDETGGTEETDRETEVDETGGTEETDRETEADEPGETSGQDEDAPVIAMTFDDGPFTKVTNRIVDVLLEYDAGATFFVVGSRIDMYSDTLKRVYENGFEIASHTWSHKNLNKLSQEEVRKEIGDTREKLNTYVPVGNVLVRPPYGNANEDVRAAAGTSLINWTLDSQDWKSKDADKIIKQVLATVKDGDIILMHDLYESTAKAVEYLVPELVERGYRIVSVSELFRLKGVTLEEGILYRNPWDYY